MQINVGGEGFTAVDDGDDFFFAHAGSVGVIVECCLQV
jgi:hypothetical protein